jgi:hypothetical protein
VRALLAQITAVYSDEQGFRQCDRGLKIYLSGAERRVTSCTAKAARVIAHEADVAKLEKKEIPAYAAIASEECAQMYRNLRLFPDLNDDPQNTTRYVVIEREEAKPSQILEDLDVKTILCELDGELDRVFEGGELKDDFEEARKEFQLMQSDAESSQPGQLRNAQARLLRAFMAEHDKSALRRLVPGGRLLGKLEKLHDQVSAHKLKGDEKSGEMKLRRLLSDPKYQSRLRSVFIIRAGKAKTQLADLLKPFYECRKKKSSAFDLRIIAELPKTVGFPGSASGVSGSPKDKDEEQGIGIIAEANGSLYGSAERFKKKRSASRYFAGGSSYGGSTQLESLLHEIQRHDPKAEIRVLGTFAKDLLGFSAQETAQGLTTTKGRIGDWRPSRFGGEEDGGIMSSPALLIGIIAFLAACAYALSYFKVF